MFNHNNYFKLTLIPPLLFILSTVRACIPCPKGTTCCGKVWGRCVCRRPKFGKCCSSVPNAACHAKNAGCYALKKPIQASLRGARAIINTARHTLNAANAALVPLRGAVKAAQLAVKGAEQGLRGVKAAFAVGLKASNIIAKVGLNGLISIREIRFRASLAVASGGSFSGSVRARFAGAAETTVRLRINLRNVKSMAKQLVSRIGSGFSRLF
jgi:hypothetical protein